MEELEFLRWSAPNRTRPDSSSNADGRTVGSAPGAEARTPTTTNHGRTATDAVTATRSFRLAWERSWNRPGFQWWSGCGSCTRYAYLARAYRRYSWLRNWTDRRRRFGTCSSASRKPVETSTRLWPASLRLTRSMLAVLRRTSTSPGN